MNARRKFALTLPGFLAVPALVFAPVFVAHATPPSGVSFVVIGRATVPAFDVKRKDKILDVSDQRESQAPWTAFDGKRKDRNRNWRIRMETEQPIDVVTAIFTVQPGGQGGWHTHPGPALFTVRTGTMTIYEGDDPTCTPHVFHAGTGTVEAGTSSHVHTLRNETNSVAETVVTFLLPVGADLRIDLPDPGYCRF